MGLPNPSRETKFSGANGDRDVFLFPVQLTTSRIGNLIRLILTLATFVTIHTYINTHIHETTLFSGANGDREIFIFPVQLITSRIGNLTRLIHTIAIYDGHTYIQEGRNKLPASHTRTVESEAAANM